MCDESTGMFDVEATKSAGHELSSQYSDAKPFPHIVIDDFLPPSVLEECLTAFPASPDPESTTFDTPAERKKTQYVPDYLSPQLRSLFYSFNSLPFIRFVENLTGIQGLIPDPYFLGGGFHELKTGGHLSIHADFNYHRRLGLERRVNVLIYLNKDWTERDGGQLELWNDAMTECQVSVVPLFNRCVVFSTTSTSMHGNPRPIAQPDGRSRKSIALYYYTATWRDDRAPHTTIFKERPGEDLQLDRPGKRALRSRAKQVSKRWLPPAITDATVRTRDKLRRRR